MSPCGFLPPRPSGAVGGLGTCGAGWQETGRFWDPGRARFWSCHPLGLWLLCVWHGFAVRVPTGTHAGVGVRLEELAEHGAELTVLAVVTWNSGSGP